MAGNAFHAALAEHDVQKKSYATQKESKEEREQKLGEESITAMFNAVRHDLEMNESYQKCVSDHIRNTGEKSVILYQFHGVASMAQNENKLCRREWLSILYDAYTGYDNDLNFQKYQNINLVHVLENGIFKGCVLSAKTYWSYNYIPYKEFRILLQDAPSWWQIFSTGWTKTWLG